MLLGAAFAPLLYQWGKDFAEASLAKGQGGILGELAESCENAKFSRYYSRSLQIWAIVLLPFLCWGISRIRHESVVGIPWKAPGLSWKGAFTQIVLGFVIAAGLLWCAGMTAELLGTYTPNPKPPSVGKFISKVMVPTVAVSFLEEWLFRGILLGLWLKLVRPFAACLGTSLFFAFIHFLEPPSGSVIADPSSPLAGFELLCKVLLHFLEPHFFIQDFAALFAIGMILAYARVRTGALWFSIGLHAGWIFAFKGFNLFHKSISDHPLRPWLVGDSLRSGLLPLLTVAITAVLCHVVLRVIAARKAG